MKYLLVLVLAFLVFGFQTDKDLIYWSESTKLEWKDFKGPVGSHPNHKAMTNAGLQTRTAMSNDTLTLESRCVFDKNKSWVREGKQPDFVLEHEQIHFDITELMCRRIKKAFMDKKFKRKSAAQEIGLLIRVEQARYVSEQIKFDRETYGDIELQPGWRERVNAELKSLEAFSGLQFKTKLVE